MVVGSNPTRGAKLFSVVFSGTSVDCIAAAKSPEPPIFRETLLSRLAKLRPFIWAKLASRQTSRAYFSVSPQTGARLVLRKEGGWPRRVNGSGFH